MIDFAFDKARAEELLRALRNREPIRMGENAQDAITLTGVCFFFACYNAANAAIRKADPGDKKQQEAILAQVNADLHIAIALCGQLVDKIFSGYFDRWHDPHVEASIDSTAVPTITPKIGFRKPPPGSPAIIN